MKGWTNKHIEEKGLKVVGAGRGSGDKRRPPVRDGTEPRSQVLHLPKIGPTLNKWYSGQHWSKRKKTQEQWERMVSIYIRKQDMRPVATYPVDIYVACRFGKGSRSYDATNLAATAKLVEDGLCAAGVLENDSNKYVRSVKLTSIKPTDYGGREGDETIVTIIEAT